MILTVEITLAEYVSSFFSEINTLNNDFLFVLCLFVRFQKPKNVIKEFIENSLQTIHEIATDNIGTKCASKAFYSLQVPLNTARYEGTRQKADLASIVLQDVGLGHYGGTFFLSFSHFSRFYTKCNNNFVRFLVVVVVVVVAN